MSNPALDLPVVPTPAVPPVQLGGGAVHPPPGPPGAAAPPYLEHPRTRQAGGGQDLLQALPGIPIPGVACGAWGIRLRANLQVRHLRFRAREHGAAQDFRLAQPTGAASNPGLAPTWRVTHLDRLAARPGCLAASLPDSTAARAHCWLGSHVNLGSHGHVGPHGGERSHSRLGAH